MNILEDMHRRMEATIAAHAAVTPPRAETPLTYETSPQSGNSPTPIHDFLTELQMDTMPQAFDYAAYVGANRGTTPRLTPPRVQRPVLTPIQTNIEDYELAGLPPTIFDGKRTNSDRFLKEFKQWRLLNRNKIEMKQPYNRVLMALNYIKGPKVDDWQEGQLTELETDNRSQDDETIWTDFEQRFKNTFTDTNKKQLAYDRLMNLRLKDGDIDTYIATFDNLVSKLGWARGEETAHVFQNGLDRGVMGAILDRPTWPVTLDEWQYAARDETNRHKARKAILGKQRPQHHITTQQQQHYQPPRDPDAMEVDRIYIRRAAFAPGGNPTSAPRALRHGQTCYICRHKGHYAKECPNKRATIESRSRPGDQSINAAQPRRWANSRLRTYTQVTEETRNTPGQQSREPTSIGHIDQTPLPQTRATLPRSGPGYQSHGNYHGTRYSNYGQTTTEPRSGPGHQNNGNRNGTRQSHNGTTWNNAPTAPPSYRTNSRTPSPTLPQSALGDQSNITGHIRQTDTQNSDKSVQLSDFTDINFVAKEIWIPLDFVTRRGMVAEKALVDCGANENCIDIKTAQKLGIKGQLLPEPMCIRNVDGTDNRGGMVKYWLPVAVFQGDRARMLKFLIVDLGRDRIILGYP
jgi:Retrotransposon gag protein